MDEPNMPEYRIEETDCYPNSFKISRIGPYREDNSPNNFFPSLEEAFIEIHKRGGTTKEVNTKD